MSVSDRTRIALREIGLSDYEYRAYYTLIISGPMTANQVSRTANLPYSKIYEVLGNLERKGWIEVERGRPMKYYPKPPSEALEVTKLRVQNAFNNSAKQVVEELEPLYRKTGVRERPDIWIVRGEFNIIAKIREMLNETKDELMMLIPVPQKQIMDLLHPILYRLKESGIKIKIMTTTKINSESLKKLVILAQVGIREEMFGGGIISDRKEAMLLLSEEKNEVNLAIWSDHIGLVKISKDYFEYLWSSADITDNVNL